MKPPRFPLLILGTLLTAATAAADSPTEATTPAPEATLVPEPAPAPAPAPAPTPVPAPAPYSVPWQLRPVVPLTVFRFDNTTAVYKNAQTGQYGVTNATMLLGAYRAWRGLSVMVRLGLVGDVPPAVNADPKKSPQRGFAFVNPALGVWYGLALPHGFKLAPFLGITLPVGMGGGDSPDPGQKTARVAGVLDRSAMDNAMFAVNDVTLFPGLDAAFVKDGITVQVEVTFLQLMRVRGAKDQPDAFKTNMTVGLHVGYYFNKWLSTGLDVRYQRWLVPPKAVRADASRDTYDNLTAAIGLRGHWKRGKAIFRPGISYGRGFDRPMTTQNFSIVQVDLPIVFP